MLCNHFLPSSPYISMAFYPFWGSYSWGQEWLGISCLRQGWALEWVDMQKNLCCLLTPQCKGEHLYSGWVFPHQEKSNIPKKMLSGSEWRDCIQHTRTPPPQHLCSMALAIKDVISHSQIVDKVGAVGCHWRRQKMDSPGRFLCPIDADKLVSQSHCLYHLQFGQMDIMGEISSGPGFLKH